MRLAEHELVELDGGIPGERVVAERVHQPPIAEQCAEAEANRATTPSVVHDQCGGTVAEGDTLQHAENTGVRNRREDDVSGRVDPEEWKPVEQVTAQEDQCSARENLAQECRFAEKFVLFEREAERGSDHEHEGRKYEVR